MSGYVIEVLHEPFEPTGYKKGDRLVYKSPVSGPTMLVIGENDIYLHTIRPNGDYWGIHKAKPNLECLSYLDREDGL